MDFEHEIRRIQDTLIVMAEIQRSQAEVQKMQAARLVEQERSFALHEQRMDHIDVRLAEMADKLDGLIGFMNGFFRKQ